MQVLAHDNTRAVVRDVRPKAVSLLAGHLGHPKWKSGRTAPDREKLAAESLQWVGVAGAGRNSASFSLGAVEVLSPASAAYNVANVVHYVSQL